MSNHEFTPSQREIGASQREPDLRRLSRLSQARDRALNTLQHVRVNPKLATAMVVVLFGQQHLAMSGQNDPVRAQEPVTGKYELFMPLVARQADFSDLEPGAEATPKPLPISPTPTKEPPKPTPTEIPPTTTPEAERAVGLQDTVVGGWNTPLDPYAIKRSLARLGFESTVDNPIDFDTKADGTGVIRASDGTPVSYRLKLTEPGTTGDHFFEVSIPDLQKAVSPRLFEELINRNLEPSKDDGTDLISHVFARDTFLFGNPQEAKKPVEHEVGESVDNNDKDGATFGNLRPVSNVPDTGASYIHKFINSYVEVPDDAGFTLNGHVSFDPKGYGALSVSYLRDGGGDSGTGISLGVFGDRLLVVGYDQGGLDGPYQFDSVIENGVINIAMTFLGPSRDKVEFVVTDAEGKKIHYLLDLKYPPTHTNTLGFDLSTHMEGRDDVYITNLDLEIPRNPDRLQNLPNNHHQQGLDELNTNAGSLGENTGVTYLETNEGLQYHDVYQGALLDEAAAVFFDRGPINSLGRNETVDREIRKANDKVIRRRPFQNTDRLNFIAQQQARKPDFKGLISYDLRSKVIADPGYDMSDFIRDFQAYHEGSDAAQGILIGAPLGLIGKSGGVGDFVAGLAGSNRKPDIQAREVAKALVAAMPTDAVLEVVPQLDPEMVFGLPQIDSLIITLNAMGAVDRFHVDTVIISAIPSYTTTSNEYHGYVTAARNALNAAGYTVYIRDADGGVFTRDQVDSIILDQTTGRDGIAILSDPRNPARFSPSARPALRYDSNRRVIRYSDEYFSSEKPAK